MRKYAKIQKLDEYGDTLIEYFEPLTMEDISTAMETEFLADAEVGEQFVVTVVEMQPEEYEAVASMNGY